LRQVGRVRSIALPSADAIALPRMPTDAAENALNGLRQRIAEAAARRDPPSEVRLLAVSKTRSAAEIAGLAALGVHAFGENYVQEAAAKQVELTHLPIEWHLIGPLQSNKCRDAAHGFDWLQSVDRSKLLPLLNQHRPPSQPPLNLLIQVNIDDEASKSGCRPEQIWALADAIAAQSRLRLRGLMAIPAPHPDAARRRQAFVAMRHLYDQLAASQPGIDTLSMGMSDDFELAIEEGATLVRIGSALFGPRSRRD
jgi:PLP dependent protein